MRAFATTSRYDSFSLFLRSFVSRSFDRKFSLSRYLPVEDFVKREETSV